MSVRSKVHTLAVAAAVACLAFACDRAGAAEPVYTDVASCRAQDLGPDEFIRHCKGPAGYAATLHYFDGRAIAGFGQAKAGARDGFDLGSVDLKAIEIGTGSPFGKRIEWVMSGAGPCAAILRVGTDRGERLLVSALDGVSTRLGMAKANDEARRIAAKACDGKPGGSAATVSSAGGHEPTVRPKVGDILPICSKCPDAAIAEVFGGGDPSVVARVSKLQAEEHCDAWYPGDAKALAACVRGVMREYGNRTFKASAVCGTLEIMSDGRRYRFDGSGMDEFGDKAPQWLDLASARRARLSAAGDRGTVSAQFEVLCPGMLRSKGF